MKIFKGVSFENRKIYGSFYGDHSFSERNTCSGKKVKKIY